jgi:hypothetical protein
MANIDWPSSLPQKPKIEGYVENPPETAIRTKMDTGPVKIRRRFTAAPREFPNCVMILTRAQRTTLDNFWDTTTEGGSKRFNWEHPITDTSGEFRFLSRPQYEGISYERFRVVFGVEMMP